MFLRLFLVLLFTTSLLLGQTKLEEESFLNGISITGFSKINEELWISTDGNGVYKYSYSKETWKNFSTTSGNLNHNFFYCIAASSRYIWAGSTDGLFIFDTRRKKWSKRKFGLGGQLSNWIRSLKFDPYENVLWIGRFKYLSKFDLQKRRFKDYDLTVNGDEKSNTFKTIEIDGDSLVWFGTESGIHKYVKRFDIEEKRSRKFYNNSSNYFNGEGHSVSLNAILPGSEYIWFGMDEFLTQENPDYNIGGIYKYDRRNNWIRFDRQDGLPANGVYALAEMGNYLWAALYQFDKESKELYGRGLAMINKTTNSVQLINDEIIPNNIHTMLFDGKFLWLGSEKGIVRIDFRNKFSPTFTSN